MDQADSAQALLASIVETSDDAIVSVSLDRTITSWNPAAEALFEYAADEVIGQSIDILLPDDQHAVDERRILDKVLAGERTPSVTTTRKAKSGRLIEISLLVSAIRDSSRRIVGASKIIREASIDRVAQAALVDSDARYRAVVETAVDGIITIDPRGIVESLNLAAETLFRVRAADIVGKNVSELMPAPYREEHDGYLHHYLETGNRKIIGIGREVVGKRGDGTTFPIDLAVSELTISGKRMFTGIVRDISERKEAEERRKLMADELDHRVKNNLATVVAIAKQTIETVDSLDAFRDAFIGRIRAMAHAHAVLGRNRWSLSMLDELILLVMRPYTNDSEHRVRTAGRAVPLTSSTTMAFSMALHELATNAAKYGALSLPTGMVDISWRTEDDELILTWRESGGPTVVEPGRNGAGWTIMRGLIEYELGGEIGVKFEPTGVEVIIHIPLNFE